MACGVTALTFVLGGARSGKSAVAERLVAATGDDVIYVATGTATDDDMAARIAAHKLRRPSSWETVEMTDLVAAIETLPPRPAIVDSLGTWVASADDFAVDTDALLSALRSRTAPTVIVSEEVGLGVHPETGVGRAWRDALGDLNQAVASVADEVLLVVAGRTIRLTPEGAA
jgi:adenosyl cobinamide kinase/adenosyl cobinamide phosphate guanylyltransferase